MNRLLRREKKKKKKLSKGVPLPKLLITGGSHLKSSIASCLARGITFDYFRSAVIIYRGRVQQLRYFVQVGDCFTIVLRLSRIGSDTYRFCSEIFYVNDEGNQPICRDERNDAIINR